MTSQPDALRRQIEELRQVPESANERDAADTTDDWREIGNTEGWNQALDAVLAALAAREQTPTGTTRPALRELVGAAYSAGRAGVHFDTSKELANYERTLPTQSDEDGCCVVCGMSESEERDAQRYRVLAPHLSAEGDGDQGETGWTTVQLGEDADGGVEIIGISTNKVERALDFAKFNPLADKQIEVHAISFGAHQVPPAPPVVSEEMAELTAVIKGSCINLRRPDCDAKLREVIALDLEDAIAAALASGGNPAPVVNGGDENVCTEQSCHNFGGQRDKADYELSMTLCDRCMELWSQEVHARVNTAYSCARIAEKAGSNAASDLIRSCFNLTDRTGIARPSVGHAGAGDTP